jgi:Peptidase C13 family
MKREDPQRVYDSIRAEAFSRLAPGQHLTTNLYLDELPRKKGEYLGPEFQKIVTEQACLLVFADDNPTANFGHDCRYLLYHPENGSLLKEIPARFPPYGNKPPETFKAFHEPVKAIPPSNLFHIPPILRCPIIFPDGTRYAILYSGMSNKRHLNDLEFCYRTLIDRYAFDPSHIYVCNYDCSLDTQDGLQTIWPGDNTPYRIQVNQSGNQAGFQAVLSELRGKLQSQDVLFIHTNNHGDNFGSGSFLCEYPNWGTYTATQFCADLATLPPFRALLVMMEQCNSGGFNAPVLAASTASATSIASAAIATQSSYASPDLNWDTFAYEWIAAQAGHDAYGGALAFNPDTNMDGVIEATEAFNYAKAVDTQPDSPNFSESSAAGGDIGLSQQYWIWWTWCWLFRPEIEKYSPPFPEAQRPEFATAVNGIAAQLQKTIVATLDRSAAEVRKELAPKIHSAFEAAFAAEKARKAS